MFRISFFVLIFSSTLLFYPNETNHSFRLQLQLIFHIFLSLCYHKTIRYGQLSSVEA